MDGVKDEIVSGTWRGRARCAGWLLMLLTCALMMQGCGADLSASQPRSRHQAALERAFPDPRAQALAIAAERGDAAEVRRLMQDEGVNPDLIFGGQDGGMPLLAWPIYSQSPDGLRAMLAAGADPNVKRQYFANGKTRARANAMVWAAEQDDPIYLAILLEHGGDPNTRNANDESLLFHAFIKQNKWRNIRLLVERGADVNALAGMGGTLVGHYASNGGFEMVHWLLEHGADPTLDYAYGKPVYRLNSHTIEGVFWHPGDPDAPSWQLNSQRWLLARGFDRPPMPKHYREMREVFGFEYEESRIPLPSVDKESRHVQHP